MLLVTALKIKYKYRIYVYLVLFKENSPYWLEDREYGDLATGMTLYPGLVVCTKLISDYNVAAIQGLHRTLHCSSKLKM